MIRLAQEMPDPELLQGSGQDVLTWVVLAMVVLYGVTCLYFVMQQRGLNALLVTNMKFLQKLSLRYARAVEALVHMEKKDED